MSSTIPQSSAVCHRVLPEVNRSACAKATLRDTRDFRVEIGLAVNRARHILGWNLNELADAVGHDPRQVARWVNGTERPHFDALFAHESLRDALLVALAALSQNAIVDTTIRIRRTA